MKKTETNPDEIWIAVYPDLKTRKCKRPDPGIKTLFWIRKTFRQKANPHTDLFDYGVFSPDLVPFTIREGSFECIEIRDHFRTLGCGNHCSILFRVADKHGVTRSFFGLGQQEAGIVEIIRLLKELAPYEDWENHDKRQQ